MIVFDFDKATRQIRELRQIADDMSAMSSQKLGAAVSCVETSWKGRTGQLFLEKCADIESRIKKEAACLRSLADRFESTARSIEEAERQAEAAAADL